MAAQEPRLRIQDMRGLAAGPREARERKKCRPRRISIEVAMSRRHIGSESLKDVDWRSDFGRYWHIQGIVEILGIT